MNIKQLRTIKEVIESDFNLSIAAQTINSSQSSISKQIKDIETTIGAEIFVRHGKKLTGLTGIGEGIADIIDSLLIESRNLENFADYYRNKDHGTLKIATTHNQAQYILPSAISLFSSNFPDVNLELIQASPKEAAEALAKGEVDIAIATEAIGQVKDIISIPCFSWHHIIVTHKNHELEHINLPTIYDISRYPIITYGKGFSGRQNIDATFLQSQVEPHIKFTAIDSEIIKTYVKIGLGIGIISELSLEEKDKNDFAIIEDSKFLFPLNITKIGLRRNAIIPSFAFEFIKLLVPTLASSGIKFNANLPKNIEKFVANLKDDNSVIEYKNWKNIANIAKPKKFT